MKGIIKFIIIFLIIILLYFIIILNIDNFTMNYNEKIQEYDNPYYMYKNGMSILDAIRMQNLTEKITDNNIYSIKNSLIIQNILEQCAKIDYDFYTYIDIIRKKSSIKNDYEGIKKLIDNNYGHMIYMFDSKYELVFTLDFKNIIYKEISYSENSNVGVYKIGENNEILNKEITEENKEEILKKSKEDLKRLGIIEDFQPETIYTSYYSEVQYGVQKDTYILEDIKNNIKVEYNIDDKKLVSLQIGFEDYKVII